MPLWTIDESADTPAGSTPALTTDDRLSVVEARMHELSAQAAALIADLGEQRQALATLARAVRELARGEYAKRQPEPE